MKMKRISKEEKEKITNKMLSYVKNKMKDEQFKDDDLYYACKTAGYLLYEFLLDYIEEKK